MTGALLSPAAAWCAVAALLGQGPAPAFCEDAAACGAGEACVAGLCRAGEERALVTVLYPVAVTAPLVLTTDAELRDAAERVEAQLRADLAWTGLYRVLAPEAHPAGQAAEGLTTVDLRRSAWQAAGAWRVVKGLISPASDGSGFRLRLRVLDVERYGALDLPEGDVVVRPGGARMAVARFVNALVARDTGLPGSVATRLAVTAEVRPGVKEIGVLDADGGAWWQVTANGSLNLGPAWGPGGSVGYMSYQRGNPDWLEDGQPLSTRSGLNAAGAWSPDGRWLALSVAEGENSDLVVLYADTGEEYAQLTDHPAVDTSPVWSPDGRQLAFVSDRSGSPQIWTISLDGTGLRRLTQGGYITSPDWSPLGGAIVYAQQVGSATFAVLRHDLTSGRVTRISPPGMSAETPTYSPDGRYVVFTRREGRRSELWIMDASGERARPVGGPALSLFSPDWRRWTPASPR